MPQNIKINNVRSLYSRVLLDEYYDFMLYKGEAYGGGTGEECLVADFSDFNIDKKGKLWSSATWTGATNEGVSLKDIGFTGIDNGFITYRKDRISNQEFLDILTGSTYDIPSGDTRFFLSPVSGNTLDYQYPMSAVTDETGKIQYLAFNGGFYQGFYKLFGFDYQTLPTKLDYGWTLSFKLRPRCDYEVLPGTINERHPENDGIFFYMGTRAENKFWEYYPNSSATGKDFIIENADTDGYMSNECSEGDIYDIYTNHVSDSPYLRGVSGRTTCDDPEEKKKEPKHHPCDSCSEKKSGVAGPEWVIHDYGYRGEEPCCMCSGGGDDPESGGTEPEEEKCGDGPIASEYFLADAKIDKDGNKIDDSSGHPFNETGFYEITTDNKFLIFNRTKTGLTTCDVEEGENIIMKLEQKKKSNNLNYFLYFNRTKTGWTTCNFDEKAEALQEPYDIYKDIKNNSFALRITKDGAIGYRFGVLDCETSAANHYSIVEEYSKSGMVKCNEWSDIAVKIAVLNPRPKTVQRLPGLLSGMTICDNSVTGDRRMKIYIYVNGYLKLVSKELPEFAFRELDDVYQKQEGVPFNISLGGGTQGLMETIGPDYMNPPKYMLPIEKGFGGSFRGDIKSFKIYDCPLDYSTIRDYLSKNN